MPLSFSLIELSAARFGRQSPEGALMLKAFSESIVLRFAGNEDAMVMPMQEEIRNVQYARPLRVIAAALRPG